MTKTYVRQPDGKYVWRGELPKGTRKVRIQFAESRVIPGPVFSVSYAVALLEKGPLKFPEYHLVPVKDEPLDPKTAERLAALHERKAGSKPQKVLHAEGVKQVALVAKDGQVIRAELAPAKPGKGESVSRTVSVDVTGSSRTVRYAVWKAVCESEKQIAHVMVALTAYELVLKRLEVFERDDDWSVYPANWFNGAVSDVERRRLCDMIGRVVGDEAAKRQRKAFGL